MNAKRPPCCDIGAGLTTKADKIRALARSGYSRTEIGDLLEVGYQDFHMTLARAGTPSVSADAKTSDTIERTNAADSVS